MAKRVIGVTVSKLTEKQSFSTTKDAKLAGEQLAKQLNLSPSVIAQHFYAKGLMELGLLPPGHDPLPDLEERLAGAINQQVSFIDEELRIA